MKVFAVIAVLVVAAQAADNACYKDVFKACKSSVNKNVPTTLPNCNARYGAIDEVVGDLQAYVNTHISRSFEYLMMSTHFANYETNRAGFEKLLRDLSDSKWHKAIELIKYITKRGGKMDFNHRKADTVNIGSNVSYELYEIESLGKSIDIEKQLAVEAFNIHNEATRRKLDNHDPEISSYLENEFVHKHAETIRKLSGYTNDLGNLLNGPDSSLSLYLFDEYLQKE